MNMKLFIKTCLMTAALMAMAVATAKAQAIQAQLVARPLTPGEIANYWASRQHGGFRRLDDGGRGPAGLSGN